MKALAHLLAWTFVASVILFVVANPQSGMVYQSPIAPLAIGMIGLGLCMQARQKMRAPSAEPRA